MKPLITVDSPYQSGIGYEKDNSQGKSILLISGILGALILIGMALGLGLGIGAAGLVSDTDLVNVTSTTARV